MRNPSLRGAAVSSPQSSLFSLELEFNYWIPSMYPIIDELGDIIYFEHKT
jgi:hypothetical protein